MSIFPLIEGEENDLALHTKICAERYKDLDNRLTSLESKVDKLVDLVASIKSDMTRTMIATGGTIVVSIIGLVGVILTKLP
jgi:predicted GTPase